MIKATIVILFMIVMGWSAFHEKFHSRETPINTIKPYIQISAKDKMIPLSQDIKSLITNQAPEIQHDLVQKIDNVFTCLSHSAIPYQKKLTVIDYSLPSNQKRLWVFDLEQQQLLYHTYVSHGLHSGQKYTVFFSNQQNSRASSIGVYKTLKSYLGREGSSLRLKGLERGFNDNAEARSIVMHGAFYTEPEFIQKYGRAGRSWGCPALPESQSKAIIDTIKEDNIMIIYYPSDAWFKKSPFLTCNNFTAVPDMNIIIKDPTLPKNYHTIHDEVLFVSGGKHFGGELPPILAVRADYYRQKIQAEVPLERMLRRRIAHEEYVALSKNELYQLAQNSTPEDLNQLQLIIATLKSNHGYMQTVMQPIPLSKIIQIKTQNGIQLLLENQQNLKLEPNAKFVRWLGL